MIVSIHQPNFFPWYPFFQKMEQSDVFVILQNCQYEKNGFQNRFNKDNKWHTMSTKSGLVSIFEKEYINHKKDWEKIKINLKDYDFLDLFDDCFSNSLSDTNTNIIKKIANILKINSKIELDFPTELKGTDRLVEICKKNDATLYISGISGKKYLEKNKFELSGIKLKYQDENEFIKKPIIDILKEKIKYGNL